jgi:HK97 family phage major capsid protein
MLDDSSLDVEAWLADKLADRFSRLENAAFVLGDGTSQPRGFLTYPTAAITDAARPWGTLEHFGTGVNGDFAPASPADVLMDITTALKAGHLANAGWVTRRSVIARIRKFKESTTNAYLWQPGLQQGQPQTLLGFPVTLAEEMPALAAGSLSLAFGDFREGYQIVDRVGVRTLRDPFTAKPFVKFYTTKRVGGGVVNFDAIKLIRFA